MWIILCIQTDDVDWFEVISENYIADFGWNREVLLKVREHYPIVMHGVSMSVGSTDPIDWDYLTALRDLAVIVEPAWVSDHLCWTGVNGVNTHDLLPLPLTKESLVHVCDRIQRIQDFMARPLVLENPSTYLEFTASDIKEWEFLNEISHQTGCGLLIDVNNIYVSSRNHGFDAGDYIESLDHSSVVQIHLAGHTDMGDHCIDTHDQRVSSAVWKLYAQLRAHAEHASVMVEWDANLPSFDDLEAELGKAKASFSEIMAYSEESTTDISTSAVSNPIHLLSVNS